MTTQSPVSKARATWRTCANGCGTRVRSDNKTGYCHRNKDCVNASNKTYREQNPEKFKNDPVRAARRQRQREHAAWMRSLKIGKACTDCGWLCTEENYPAFDWDHRPGEVKSFGVARASRSTIGQAKVLSEIAKCDLRCKNCHAVITHKRRKGEGDGV